MTGKKKAMTATPPSIRPVGVYNEGERQARVFVGRSTAALQGDSFAGWDSLAGKRLAHISEGKILIFHIHTFFNTCVDSA
jgi:hypothetical protein